MPRIKQNEEKKTAPGETGAGNAEERHASADSMYRRSANYELKLCLERTKRGAAKRMAELTGYDSMGRGGGRA